MNVSQSRHQCHGHLDLDEGGKTVDQTLYRSMIGSLLYFTASRLDIMFSVCMCARFQANPKEAYLIAVKRILRYLKHTPSIGLWYPKGARFELVGYSDLDYAGCKVDRKSTSGGCHLLGRSLVSLMRTSLLHRIQVKERRRSSIGVQFIFLMVEA